MQKLMDIYRLRHRRKHMIGVVKAGYQKNEYAEIYRQSEEPDPLERKFLEQFLRKLPLNPTVLDLGCGTGMPYDKFFCNNGCLVTGIDISSRHINLARSNVPQATFILGDFSKLDLGKKFDGIISLYAIFHIPRHDQIVLLKRITAHLSDGGMLLITLGTGDGYFEQDWCGSQMAWDQHDPDVYLDTLRRNRLDILEAAFEPSPGDAEKHFWVIAQKNEPK